MADLPAGAKFGSLVHAVLETADPFAADLAAELEAQIREHSVWWPVDVTAAQLAAALVPMHDTPLGRWRAGSDAAPDRACGIGCASWTSSSRWPAAISRAAAPRSGWPTWARCCAEHLPADDPLARYADRLTGDGAGRSAAARIPERARSTWCCGCRRTGYVVVDYKTNWLGGDAAVDACRLSTSRG